MNEKYDRDTQWRIINKDIYELFVGKWMDVETITLSEINKTEVKCHIVSIISETQKPHKIRRKKNNWKERGS